MNHYLHHTRPRSRNTGLTLVESLVAIVIMALGILGVMGIQMRTLVDTQTGIHRAQAIRLIENLSERLQANPDGLGSLSNYAANWVALPATIPTASCPTGGCNAVELAAVDVYQFRTAVRETLPLGQARVFLSEADTAAANRRQLGIMVAWRENERVREGDSAADTDAYKAVFKPADTSSNAANNITCPADHTCHLQYIQPNQRCVPFALGALGAQIPLYCPN